MTRIYKKSATIGEEPFDEVIGFRGRVFRGADERIECGLFLRPPVFLYNLFALSRISFLVGFRAPTDILGRKIAYPQLP